MKTKIARVVINRNPENTKNGRIPTMLDVVLTIVFLFILNPGLFAANILTVVKNIKVVGENGTLTTLPESWRNEGTLIFGLERVGFGVSITSLIGDSWTEGPLVLGVINHYRSFLGEPIVVQRLLNHFQVLLNGNFPTNVTPEKMSFVDAVRFYVARYTTTPSTAILQTFYLIRTEMDYQLEVFRPIIAVFTSEARITRGVEMLNGKKGTVIELEGVPVNTTLARKYAESYGDHVLIVALPDRNFSVTTNFEGGKEYVKQVADRVGVIIKKNTQGKENIQEVCILDPETGRFYSKNLTSTDVNLPEITQKEFWGIINDCLVPEKTTQA